MGAIFWVFACFESSLEKIGGYVDVARLFWKDYESERLHALAPSISSLSEFTLKTETSIDYRNLQEIFRIIFPH
jgi:hypothetical protein